MATHASFMVDTGIQVYCCEPHHPWQHGTNEHTNGLLRQYLPRSLDLSTLSEEQLDAIADELSGRPRETLGWRTPSERFAELVVALTKRPDLPAQEGTEPRPGNAWPHRRPGPHLRTSPRGRGPSCPWPLGGRSRPRTVRPLPGRHLGRARRPASSCSSTCRVIARQRPSKTPWRERSPPCPRRCCARSPGIKERRWPHTPPSRWTPASRSTSWSPITPGSVERTSTPMGWPATTCRGASTSPP
jgi:hypothetical protein